MGEMIERVSKAIARSHGSHITGPSRNRATDEFGWHGSQAEAINQYAEAHWKEWQHAAQFAIEALREPTNEMIEVGTEARWRSAVRDADNVREIFAAMIDAALTASPDTASVVSEDQHRDQNSPRQDGP